MHSGALWLVTIYTEIVSIKLYFGILPFFGKSFNIKLISVTDIEQRVRRGDAIKANPEFMLLQLSEKLFAILSQ